MYLKKLEAQGFKSFADKTEMSFTHGITSIVGPNGSGKSNISDAIRWVMGEQSARSLRGSNMQDIIFAGTQTRKSVGFAEVTLTIDNTSHILPSEYTEVSVTRRVFRSGESEYYINKANCRLKDIHELLMDTGLGRDGYSIIGQGKIDEILSQRSEDRRQIFEEAAGISKYRYRKEEAQRKLSHTEDNLTRIGDIITELENQLEPLRHQSDKAKIYLSLRDELKILEVNTFLEGADRAKITLSEVIGIYDDVNNQADEINNQILAIEKEVEELYERSRKNDFEADQFREQEKTARELQNSFTNEIELFKSKIQFSRQTVQRLKEEVEQTSQKINELNDSILKGGSNISALVKKESELAVFIEELANKIAALEETTQRDSSKIEELQGDIIEGINAVSEMRTKIGNIITLKSSYETRRFNIDEELLQKNMQKQQREKELEETTCTLSENTNIVEASKQKVQEILTRFSALAAESESMRNKKRESESAYNIKFARLRTLSDMEKDFEGYNRSVKGVMQSTGGELKGASLYGTVAQLIDVPKKYAVAIETALAGSLQYIVTQTEQDAKRAIEFLKKRNLGRATFLPISTVTYSTFTDNNVDKCKGFIGVASTMVNCDSKFRNIAESLLGKIVVVDNIDNAIAMAKQFKYRFRIVTLDGELLAPGGSMSGGSRGNSTGIFTRANEIKELEGQVDELKTVIKSINDKEISLQAEILSLEQRKETETIAMRDAEQINVRITTEISHYKLALEDIGAQISALVREQTEIDTQIGYLSKDADSIKGDIDIKESEIDEFKREMENLKLGSTDVADKHEKLQSEQLELKMDMSNLQKDIAHINERAANTRSEIHTCTLTLEAKTAELENELEEIEELESEIEFKEAQIRDQDELLEELKNSAESAVERRRNADEDIKLKQQESNEKRDNLIKVQQELARLENRKVKAEVEVENIVNRLWEEYELTLTTAEDFRQDIVSFSKAQKQVNELKNQIKNLGNINVGAIDEYKNIKERFEFLDAQRNDLTNAKANLEKIIHEMQEIMKKQFSVQFDVINWEFNNVFTELFSGGRALLKLSEPDNVLESGIEIEVQPAGKQVQNISLLSGGEKALTAIALLLAILRVRPTPFCILDEIDAALDDVNVTRYVNYIRRFSDKTQFVLITHKRGTMESSDMLYGVTMQEKGVSSVLSLSLDQIKNN